MVLTKRHIKAGRSVILPSKGLYCSLAPRQYCGSIMFIGLKEVLWVHPIHWPKVVCIVGSIQLIFYIYDNKCQPSTLIFSADATTTVFISPGPNALNITMNDKLKHIPT